MAPLMLCLYNNLTKTGYFWRQIQIVRKSQFKFSVKLKCVSSGKTFPWFSWCHVTIDIISREMRRTMERFFLSRMLKSFPCKYWNWPATFWQVFFMMNYLKFNAQHQTNMIRCPNCITYDLKIFVLWKSIVLTNFINWIFFKKKLNIWEFFSLRFENIYLKIFLVKI